jgi:hypothetical protein
MSAPIPRRDPGATLTRATSSHRWLLFVHQLPSTPSHIRVRTWRRMQQIGALVIKQSVYVLPDSPGAREDFEWLKSEIEGAGGEASVFAADTVDSWSNDALVDEFRRAREEAYSDLAREAEKVLRRISAGGRREQGDRSARRELRRRAKVTPPRRLIQQLRERLAAIERVDFFGSAGRDRVRTLLDQIEDRVSPVPRGAVTTPTDRPTSYQGRTWVTRPRPGVDRMASAWLIRRFIDADAHFGFVADREAAPPDSIPFDMFGVEFTHRGDLCTFETLCATFHLVDPALASIGAIVHDLDLKDERFGTSEAPGVGAIIEGLRLTYEEDEALLTAGIGLFEALYRVLVQAERMKRPRPVAKARPMKTRRPSSRSR